MEVSDPHWIQLDLMVMIQVNGSCDIDELVAFCCHCGIDLFFKMQEIHQTCLYVPFMRVLNHRSTEKKRETTQQPVVAHPGFLETNSGLRRYLVDFRRSAMYLLVVGAE